ncbi:S9 family peptidase [Shewanella sp. VB17]|uniref:S9 family peptidase n=1 Tax=Shewanella sp. VB17 TaxID=2739432 RepID=UPI0015675677|nr:prolyl oligopeptidase family serine peptidase [Shewanella sp. VB17]NRD74776.1 S9 family peptidase [Shewanella sp. VB17]
MKPPLLMLYLICVVILSLLTACEPAAPQQEIDQTSGRQIAVYGSWRSPITAQDVVMPADKFGELQSVNGGLYFIQSQAELGGKVGIKRLDSDHNIVDVVKADFDVKSTVNGYGGSPFLGIGSSLFVSKADDQLLYRIAPNQAPVPLTSAGTRHADCVTYSKGSRIICIREDHRGEGEPVSSLVALNLNFANGGEVLTSGRDFYSSPRVSPDNSQLAWISWQHPNMPWDNTELWIGTLDPKGGILQPKRLIPELQGAITQPLFSPSGQLYFVADFNNWWNIYRLSDNGKIEHVLDIDAEFAVPDWKLGNHNYAFESDNTIIASYQRNGDVSLIRIYVDTGAVESIAVDFGEISQLIAGDNGIYFIGDKITPEKGIYKINGRGTELVYAPELPVFNPNFISQPKSIIFDSGNKEPVYGYFYGPKNPAFIAPTGTRPPLLVMLHRGPTSKASLAFRRDIQYWTSRGFAVMDLNYRGSSGFGREYRRSIYGRWGQADVEDAVRSAGYLVNKGWVDGTKLAMRGRNAGGLTVLSVLAFYNTFKAGVSYSGISDIDVLNEDLNKFESHYVELLMGKNENELIKRSPMYNLSGLTEPLLLIQGSDEPHKENKQSKRIFTALKNKGVPIAYLSFDGENYRLRDPKNKATAMEAELSFYGTIFGFTPADDIPKLKLINAQHFKKQ